MDVVENDAFKQTTDKSYFQNLKNYFIYVFTQKTWFLVFVAFFIIFIVFLVEFMIPSTRDKYWKTYINQERQLDKLQQNQQPSGDIPDKRKNNIDIPVYYINMDRSTKRKENLESELNQYDNVKYTRVPAIDGMKLHNSNSKMPQQIDGDEIHLNTDIESFPEIACTLSHIKAIKKAYDDDCTFAVICEDDVSFKLNNLWTFSLSHIIVNAPVHWNVISIYNPNHTMSKPHKYTKMEKLKNGWGRGTVAYIINRKGMKNIIDYFIQDDVMTINYERVYGSDHLIYEKCGNSYMYSCSLVYTNNENFESTIGHNVIKYISISSKIIKDYLEEVKENH